MAQVHEPGGRSVQAPSTWNAPAVSSPTESARSFPSRLQKVEGDASATIPAPATRRATAVEPRFQVISEVSLRTRSALFREILRPEMSEENLEAVRAVYDRWAEGDFQTRLELLDPNVVLVHEPEFEAGGPSYGIDAVVAFTRGMLEAWTRFTIAAEEIIPAGDSVLVEVNQRGIGRASGVATDLHYFMVWTFRGGKVVRFESIRERTRAFKAAGLSE